MVMIAVSSASLKATRKQRNSGEAFPPLNFLFYSSFLSAKMINMGKARQQRLEFSRAVRIRGEAA